MSSAEDKAKEVPTNTATNVKAELTGSRFDDAQSANEASPPPNKPKAHPTNASTLDGATDTPAAEAALSSGSASPIQAQESATSVDTAGESKTSPIAKAFKNATSKASSKVSDIKSTLFDPSQNNRNVAFGSQGRF